MTLTSRPAPFEIGPMASQLSEWLASCYPWSVCRACKAAGLLYTKAIYLLIVPFFFLFFLLTLIWKEEILFIHCFLFEQLLSRILAPQGSGWVRYVWVHAHARAEVHVCTPHLLAFALLLMRKKQLYTVPILRKGKGASCQRNFDVGRAGLGLSCRAGNENVMGFWELWSK